MRIRLIPDGSDHYLMPLEKDVIEAFELRVGDSVELERTPEGKLVMSKVADASDASSDHAS